MHFYHKLLAVGLGILLFTLLLSSVLSLASFEKIYAASLVSTYEVSGKTLQRKIESALRFGKPLSGIIAMDDMLAEMRASDAAISRIDVVDKDKRLLYSTTPDSRDEPSPYAAEYPDFSDSESQVATKRIRRSYVIFLPLRGRSKELAGFLNLEFPREVVVSQLRRMAWENVKTLAPIIAVAVLLQVLLIRLLVTLPIGRRMAQLVRWVDSPTVRDAGPPVRRRMTDTTDDELSALEHELGRLVAVENRCEPPAVPAIPTLEEGLAALDDSLARLHESNAVDPATAAALAVSRNQLAALLHAKDGNADAR